METTSACKTCFRAIADGGWSSSCLPVDAADDCGVIVTGGQVCVACWRAAATARAEAAAAAQTAKAAQAAHRAAQAKRFAPAPPPAKSVRRPRLSAAARARRAANREEDRLARGGHPWREDEE